MKYQYAPIKYESGFYNNKVSICYVKLFAI